MNADMLNFVDSPNTQVTVAVRAAVAMKSAEHEKALTELAKASVHIVSITNADGKQQCHSARMALKTARIDIQARGKDAREDARKYADAVVKEEKRLISLVEPEEKRLQTLQEGYEAEQERAKAARIEAERQRVASIRARISGIVGTPVAAAMGDIKTIEHNLRHLESLEIGPAVFQEFAPEAEHARAEALAAVRAMYDNEVKRQEELASERAQREITRKRQEEERQLQAAEAVRLKAEREEFEKQQRAARELQEAEARTLKAEHARLATERERAAADERELQRVIDERRRKVQAEDDQRRAQLQEEADKLAAQRAELERVLANATKPVIQPPASAPSVESAIDDEESPPVDEVVEVVADYYGVANDVARGWLEDLFRSA